MSRSTDIEIVQEQLQIIIEHLKEIKEELKNE